MARSVDEALDDAEQRVKALEQLIQKYIHHVFECEGSDFLAASHAGMKDKSGITEEEWAELNEFKKWRPT